MRGRVRWARRALAAGLGLAVAATLGVATPAPGQMSDHPREQPLRVGAELGFQPFAFKQADGSVAGFAYDLNKELAARLGRPSLEVVDIVFANIFAAMHAKRIEFIMAPTTITPPRAAEMLFSEPYFDITMGFMTRKDRRLASMDDLKGKTIAVTSGSVQDDWMKQNAAKHGVTVQRFDKTADAVQAVVIRRVDGYMSTGAQGLWTAKSQPDFAFDVSFSTGGQFGLPFRKDDVEFRNLVEGHLECAKSEGALAAIYKKWFDVDPDPKSSTVTVYPGVGAPGWPGHDAGVARAVACKR